MGSLDIENGWNNPNEASLIDRTKDALEFVAVVGAVAIVTPVVVFSESAIRNSTETGKRVWKKVDERRRSAAGFLGRPLKDTVEYIQEFNLMPEQADDSQYPLVGDSGVAPGGFNTNYDGRKW